MNNTLKIVLTGVAGVIIGFLATLFVGALGSAPVGGSTNFGGDLVVDALTVNSTLTQTGAATFSGNTILNQFTHRTVNSTSTTATAYTLVSADVVGYSTISITPNGGALALTLPASSTMSTWLPNNGDRTNFLVFNATTTANQNLSFVAGTGSLLEVASSTGATSVTGPAKAVIVEVFRKWNTDLVFLVRPFI